MYGCYPPILLIEEDPDDVEIISGIINEISTRNQVLAFPSLAQAITYINNQDATPSLILCDTNCRNKNRQLHEVSRLPSPAKLRSIPFVFYSASADDFDTRDAFAQLNIQGFFRKAPNYQEIKEKLETIIGNQGVR